jgi:hypothetical protein
MTHSTLSLDNQTAKSLPIIDSPITTSETSDALVLDMRNKFNL